MHGQLEQKTGWAHLAHKSQRLLIKSTLLGVSDVGGYDFVERQAMIWLFESYPILLSLDGKFASNGILDFEEARVEILETDGGHERR